MEGEDEEEGRGGERKRGRSDAGTEQTRRKSGGYVVELTVAPKQQRAFASQLDQQQLHPALKEQPGGLDDLILGVGGHARDARQLGLVGAQSRHGGEQVAADVSLLPASVQHHGNACLLCNLGNVGQVGRRFSCGRQSVQQGGTGGREATEPATVEGSGGAER